MTISITTDRWNITVNPSGASFKILGKGKGKKKREKWAIVNLDSPWTPRIVEGCTAHVLSYGIESLADVHASDIRLEQEGTRALVTYQGKSIPCFWPLVGRFNVYNCLAALVLLYLRKSPWIRRLITCPRYILSGAVCSLFRIAWD